LAKIWENLPKILGNFPK